MGLGEGIEEELFRREFLESLIRQERHVYGNCGRISIGRAMMADMVSFLALDDVWRDNFVRRPTWTFSTQL